MFKSKIVIPVNKIWRVFRNNLEFSPEYIDKAADKAKLQKLYSWESLGNKIPQLQLFNNPQTLYIMNIPNSVNSIKNSDVKFWDLLNVKGGLEINSPCSFYLYFDKTSFSELNLNSTSKDFSKINLEYWEGGDEHKPNPSKLEKVNINVPTAEIAIRHFENIKEININSKKIIHLSLVCPNLEKLSFGQLDEFVLSNNRRDYGLNPFSNSMYALVDNKMLPDNCLLTFKKKCTFTSKSSFLSCCPLTDNDKNEISADPIPFENFINSQTAKTYIDNKNETFSITFKEFKSLVKKEVLKTYQQAINSQKEQIEKEISEINSINQTFQKRR